MYVHVYISLGISQAMEKLTAEKNTMKETYEAQLRTLDEESRTTVHKLNNQHRREIETLEQSQREHNSSEQTKAETRFMQMKQVFYRSTFHHACGYGLFAPEKALLVWCF